MLANKKDKSAKAASPEGLSMDDFDALVTLHGLLCAFLVSVAMATQSSVTHPNMPYATFLSVTCKQQGFRNFIHEVLNETGFNFNVPVMAGVKLDLEHELLYGVLKRFPWQSPPELHHISTGRGDDTLPSLLEYEPLRIMVPLLYPVFPQEYTEAYLIKNEKAYRPQKQGSIAYVSATATSLLISGLCTNVVLYIALLVSPAKEDETGKAARAFESIALPIIYVQYFSLVIAIGCMSYAGSYVLCFNTPFAKSSLSVNYWFYSIVR